MEQAGALSRGSGAVTWHGHATVSVRDEGVHLLTDPLLTDRVAHLRRRRGPTPDIALGSVNAVLVSHLHLDHCHVPSLRLLPPGTRVVLPRGGAGLLAALPLDVVEVEPGDAVDVRGVRIVAVRAQHDGRRSPGSRWAGPALGFLIQGSRSVWFAGDTGWAPDLGHDVGPVDVAVLPVGGWGPVSRPSTRGQHLGPAEAAAVACSLPAATVVPVHYGTFWPVGLPAHRHPGFLRPGGALRDAVAQSGGGPTVHVLEPGATLSAV
jgi:L-ascorbate metabolism protein UlaG (beta-lactamase superfamily)